MKFQLPSQLSKKDYPYMYARVSAKRAKLLDGQDYENLLKMKPNEIEKKLGEGDYKDEIDELGTGYEGVQLVELALNRNLANTMHHISDIAPESLEDVIGVYLRKYDIMTLKRLLRWKKGGEKGEVSDMLTPVSGYDLEELGELANQDFDEIVNSIQFDSPIDYQEYIEGRDKLNDIELALDRAYYDELSMLAEKVSSQPFRDFIQDEMEYQNVRTALRLKKHGVEAEEIREHLLNGKESSIVTEVVEADSFEQAVQKVNSEYDEVDEDSLEELEHSLDTERLQNALRMLHTEPLGITSILGYIIAKVVEVRNLRMLIRAKETGIQNPETIRKNLVVA
jgi:V/A-type H+-transporting ATPase subunit C